MCAPQGSRTWPRVRAPGEISCLVFLFYQSFFLGVVTQGVAYHPLRHMVRPRTMPHGGPGSPTPSPQPCARGRFGYVGHPRVCPQGPQRVFWCPPHRDPPRQSGGILWSRWGGSRDRTGVAGRPSPSSPGLGRGVRAPFFQLFLSSYPRFSGGWAAPPHDPIKSGWRGEFSVVPLLSVAYCQGGSHWSRKCPCGCVRPFRRVFLFFRLRLRLLVCSRSLRFYFIPLFVCVFFLYRRFPFF